MPHQLFESSTSRPRDGTTFVLVEHDLLFRQYRFHAQKLVLHRASMRRFARAAARGRASTSRCVETDGRHDQPRRRCADARPAAATHRGRPSYDVVDDWLGQRPLRRARRRRPRAAPEEVLETPNFLTTRAAGRRRARLGDRQRTDAALLRLAAAAARRARGRTATSRSAGSGPSTRTNRKKLPAGPPGARSRRGPTGTEDVERGDRLGRASAFPDNPGRPRRRSPGRPAHAEADTGLRRRSSPSGSREFGPYEDALVDRAPVGVPLAAHPAAQRRAARPAPRRSTRASTSPRRTTCRWPALEGFVRQVIGWREYMRATYVLLRAAACASRNRLEHDAPARPRRGGRRAPVWRPSTTSSSGCSTTAGPTTSSG